MTEFILQIISTIALLILGVSALVSTLTDWKDRPYLYQHLDWFTILIGIALLTAGIYQADLLLGMFSFTFQLT